MFDRYTIAKRIKNRDILRSFSFQRMVIGNRNVIKFTKNSGTTPLVFFLDLDGHFPILWNLLEQHYFPSSISILAKLGKSFSNNYRNDEERMVSAISDNIVSFSLFFGDSRVNSTIGRYFKYRNISFKSNRNVTNLYVPYHRSKGCNIIRNHSHPLIRYFRYIAFSAIYEKAVFDAIVKLFEMATDSADSVDNLLDTIKIENNEMYLNSLFSQVNGQLVNSNYGVALANSYLGNVVFVGNIPWDRYAKSTGDLTTLLQGQDIAFPYRAKVREMEEKAKNTRVNVLTESAASEYNEAIPDVCYW